MRVQYLTQYDADPNTIISKLRQRVHMSGITSVGHAAAHPHSKIYGVAFRLLSGRNMAHDFN